MARRLAIVKIRRAECKAITAISEIPIWQGFRERSVYPDMKGTPEMKAAQYTVLALASALAFGATALAQPSTPSATPKVLDVRDMLKEVSISALVTAIDPKNRIVTLKGPEGNEFAVMVDARVKNLAQVKVGDMVDATYIQSVALDFQTGNGIRMASSAAGGHRGQGRRAAGRR